MPLGHEHFMRLALKEAVRGGAEGNLAVASVIVQGEDVVARGRNREAETGEPTAHAETVAVRTPAHAAAPGVGGPERARRVRG